MVFAFLLHSDYICLAQGIKSHANSTSNFVNLSQNLLILEGPFPQRDKILYEIAYLFPSTFQVRTWQIILLPTKQAIRNKQNKFKKEEDKRALLKRMLLALFADSNLSPLRLAHLFTRIPLSFIEPTLLCASLARD